jgi:lipopolysaccharide/colanic/teichoic acid biosynthesis glycosyltransferase
MMKRIYDILLASCAIFLLSPIFLITSVILFFTGEREILYLQNRVGKNEKIFKLYKFATMLKNSDQMGTGTITVKNDTRILPFGHFLRKTKINELPQLLNIIIGDMSIVGPRPLTLQNFEMYSNDIKNKICKVRPGLSGIGSIVFRNEEEILDFSGANINFYEKTITPYKGELESWFFSNNTQLNYFKIILMTLYVIMFKNTKLLWKIFKDLPKPPKELKNLLQ